MSKGKSLTFYGLFDIVDSIEIPILQRDYAQGRAEELEVRTRFLNSLFDVLNTDDPGYRQPLDLDFVYGNFEDGQNKAFSVLDGQQRLTTLFLLHWYLAVQDEQLAEFRSRFVISNQRQQSRFTYKTRPSTTEFFDALTSKDIVLSTGPISSQIRNSQWFYLSWLQDPTVQACLNMLDAIQKRFSCNSHNLYERLTNTRDPYITFQFLDLRSFGLSDELYIKMNARGKPLTVFENFKAKLEQKIKSFDAPWPAYELPFKDNSADGYEYFIHKVDTDWADLFWPYRNVCSDDNTFDDEIMHFIRLIIAYQYLIDNETSPQLLGKAKSDIFGLAGRVQQLKLFKYEELNCFSQNLIVRLIEILDLIYGKGLTDNQITAYLDDQTYYSEEKTFKKIISNTASYDDKLRFYAFYTHLAKNKEPSELAAWMRVIYNLVENTIINTTDEFHRALFSINRLCQSDTPILEKLKGNCKLSGFTSAQILEEKIKAHLLLKSGDWKQLILNVEKHPFFKGQIGCILNFSGILAFYREHEDCDWGEELNDEYFNSFRDYASSVGAVFKLIINSSSKIDYLWERAVLSKGNYFTEKTGNRYNLLSTRETKNNIPRDHSWRRLLRIDASASSAIEKKQEYVKTVFDDPLFDPDNIEVSLDAICEKALANPDMEEWRKALIKHKALINYCNQGFISITPSEIILLSESQRNHYHSEIYTKALTLELDKEQVKPFTQIGYRPVKSREEYACATITGWKFYDTDYSIEIGFYNDRFFIWFKGVKLETGSDELATILNKHDFELEEPETGSTSIYCNYLNKQLSNTTDTMEKLASLCSELMELNDE